MIVVRQRVSATLTAGVLQRALATAAIPTVNTDVGNSIAIPKLEGGRLTRLKAVAEAKKWLANEGKQYRNQSESRFLGRGGATPFPHNPLFKPVPPLSDTIRQEIYDTHISDPNVQTPLNLATRYKISIARVQAILRLKGLQQRKENYGVPIQVQLTYHMEKLLKAGGTYRIVEPVRIMPTERLKPVFQFIDEADAISPEDAAKLLEIEPYANVQAKLDKKAEKIFSKDGLAETTSAFDEKKSGKSKFKFNFVDISKVDAKTTHVYS
ncbi:hypothetical protein HK100_012093 [Physocladia obscura]|uniref:Uncharacterized protein n=1 Tax=Physocladia obscura TaxID=109957 RepID=A0AAD5T9Y9_9FUNG|nr:hypothetical protein HK100_012093 [Physocladia obscura]